MKKSSITIAIIAIALFVGIAAKAEEPVRFKEADCKYFAVENGAKFGACVQYISQSADKDGIYTSVLTLQEGGCRQNESGKSAYGTKVSLTTDGETKLVAIGIPGNPDRCFIQALESQGVEKASGEKTKASASNTDKAKCKSKVHKTFTIAKFAVVANTLINLTCKGDCTKSLAGTAGISNYELIDGLQESTACDSFETEDGTTVAQQPQQQAYPQQQVYPPQVYYPQPQQPYYNNSGYYGNGYYGGYGRYYNNNDVPGGSLSNCNSSCMQTYNNGRYCNCVCQNACN